ncbi:hypothetical protein BC830DRAFT_1150366 [Chytriomyces sp. MP71]|nr:hypothetical protein BC830DRAFT_1150366 [Chytriomyces sp. MP71]
MNQTNETLSNPWVIYADALNTVTVQACWNTFGISVFLFACLALICWREWQCAENRQTAKSRVYSQINLLVVTMLITNHLYLLFNVLSYSATNFTSAVVYNCLGNFSIFLFLVLSMYYAWIRNFTILKIVAKRSLPYFRGSIVLFTLLQLIQFFTLVTAWFITFPETETMILTYASSMGEIILLLFDAAGLIAFITFLHNDDTTSNNDKDRLGLVSWYGIASFVVFQVYLAASVASTYVTGGDVPPFSLEGYIAVNEVASYAPLVYAAVQVMMKGHIHWARELSKMERTRGDGVDATGRSTVGAGGKLRLLKGFARVTKSHSGTSAQE